MGKRHSVERREEGAELPDNVPILPVRLDSPGADVELDGLPLTEEPPKDFVDLDALGREPGPGQNWVIVDLDLADLFGQVVSLEKGDTVAGTRALHKIGSSHVVCMRMADLCLSDIVVWAEG